MEIKDTKLLDLYKRFMNFIISNYPDAVPDERNHFILVGYPGELARFTLSYEKEYQSLKVRLSRDITQKLTESNGRTYYISSLDELNSVKYAVQAVMDLKIPKAQASSVNTDRIAKNDQGYLLDYNKEILGIVYLDRIPTSAYVHDTDEINKEQVAIVDEPPQKRPTLSRFFKK